MLYAVGFRQEPSELADQPEEREIPMRYRVTCTVKLEAHACISHLGCHTTTNVYLNLSEAEVIRRIESRADTFFVERPSGHIVEVVVAEREGKKYLKTEADGERPDNLLSLPDCPARKQDGSGAVRTVVAAASHGDGDAAYWGA
jgi:hypothetical protein